MRKFMSTNPNQFYFSVDICKSGVETKTGEFYVEGYAATTDLDRQNDIIAIEALEKAAKRLMESGTTVFFNHDYNRCVGKLISATTDTVGLLVKIYVSKWEEELRQKIEEGIINKFSVGGKLRSASQLSPEEVMERFSDTVTEKPNEPVNLVNDLDLFEVSIVGLPANARAEFIHKSLYDAIKEEVTKVEIKKDEAVEAQASEPATDEVTKVEKKYECKGCGWSGTTPKEEEEDGKMKMICPECGAEVVEVSEEEEEPKEEEEMVEGKSDEVDEDQLKELVSGAEDTLKTEDEEAKADKPYYYYGKDTKERLDKVEQAVMDLHEKIKELNDKMDKLAESMSAKSEDSKSSEELGKILEAIESLNSKVKEIPVTAEKSTPIVTPEKKIEKKVEVPPSPEETFLGIIKGSK